MNWTSEEAEATSGVLIQDLINLLPDIRWERANAEGDSGQSLRAC